MSKPGLRFLKSGRDQTPPPIKGQIDEENCEQYGMFTLEDKPPDATKMIDIVAVHGLNGRYLRTWSARGPDGAQVNWLRDFLPK
jgi:hypothetical protein